MEKRTSPTETVKTPERARQATRKRGMPAVLGISLLAATVLLVAIPAFLFLT